jgi:type III pantothenate kinase
VDAVVQRIDEELGGGSTVLATGGLGGLFMGTAKSICCYEPTLTLEGLILAYHRLGR